MKPEDLHSFTQELRTFLKRSGRYGGSSCILMTKMIIEEMQANRIPAQPASVSVLVGQKAVIAQEVETTEENYPVQIDRHDGTTGHVVALVDLTEGRFLADGAIDQASRPDRGFGFEGVMVLPWMEGNAGLFFGPEDSLVAYWKLRPLDEPWWEDSPNWGARDAIDRMAFRNLARKAI